MQPVQILSRQSVMKGDTFQMLLSSRAPLVTCEERSDRWVGRFVKHHHYVLDTPFEVPG